MNVPWLPLEITAPQWLWGLVLLPALVLFLRQTLANLPRHQLQAALVVRSAIIVLVLLALCRLTLLRPTDEVYVVFAVDNSLSISEPGNRRAEEFVASATASVDPSRYSVLNFASKPGTSLPQRLATDEVTTNDDRNPNSSSHDEWRKETDIQAAIQLAVARVPPHSVPHIVLLSDGNETIGDSISATSSTNARISTVRLPTRDEPEIQVSDVIVPPQVAEGEPFEIEVVVDSNHDDVAIVEVFSGDYRIAADVKELTKGENRFRYHHQVNQTTELQALVRSPGDTNGDSSANAQATTFTDTLLDNNVASGIVFTTGKPQVLLIERDPEQARNLEWAMDEEGIDITTRPVSGVPDSLADLQKFQVLILSNVAATELSVAQMELIRTWVSELGGGFIMLGGDESFGLGGYYKTVVEEVLPVRCDFEKEKEKPGLGMVLVIDKSGSMGGQKIELAKEAARAAVDLLTDKDRIGVIAFDGNPYWVSEVRPGSQKGVILDRIASIEAGGGTTLYPAMDEAFQALLATNAKLKHIIILTDGYSTPGDFEAITQEMLAARMTVSTVGIGDADQQLLEKIAQTGNGRYYYSNDASAIPQIFARETITASKAAIKEEPFLPMLVQITPVLADIDFDTAPFLLGHVVTRPKATSEIILTTETGEPLLAWWRYGLGMSVAFTSDAQSRWAAEWLTWPGFNRFWAQTIRHCMQKSQAGTFSVNVRRQSQTATITIEASDRNGQFLNEAPTELTVVPPTMQSMAVPVQQVAPGRYEASVQVNVPGAWHFQASQQSENSQQHQSRGLVVGYSAEFRLRSPNDALLKGMAEMSGGDFNPSPDTVFRPVQTEQVSAAVPLWPALLTIAMLLFVADVALRRLEFSRIFGRQAYRNPSL